MKLYCDRALQQTVSQIFMTLPSRQACICVHLLVDQPCYLEYLEWIGPCEHLSLSEQALLTSHMFLMKLTQLSHLFW